MRFAAIVQEIESNVQIVSECLGGEDENGERCRGIGRRWRWTRDGKKDGGDGKEYEEQCGELERNGDSYGAYGGGKIWQAR